MKAPKQPVTVSEEEITITAALAGLDLDGEDRRRFAAALNAILGHFEVIARVETAGELQGTPVERAAALGDLRDDLAVRKDPAPLHGAAPDFAEGFFFVPRVTQ